MARPSPAVAVLHLVLFRVALVWLLALPRWLYLRFAMFVGTVATKVAPRYTRTSRKNLRLAFPERFRPGRGEKPDDDASDPALEAFIRLYYRHVFISFMEGFLGPRIIHRTSWHKYWTVCMSPGARAAFEKARREPPGVLLCTGHIGPWELSIHPTAISGFPITVIARPIDSYLIDADVNAMRDRHGNRTITKFGRLQEQIRDLRQGRSLGLVIDQDAGKWARGTFVEFFGRLCKCVDAPALLAHRYGAAMIPSFPVRVGQGTDYRLYFYDPIDTSGDIRDPRTLQRIMQDWHRALEDIVRRHPEQYYWLHHKWRTRPPGEPGAGRFVDAQPGAEELARQLGYYGGDDVWPGADVVFGPTGVQTPVGVAGAGGAGDPPAD